MRKLKYPAILALGVALGAFLMRGPAQVTPPATVKPAHGQSEAFDWANWADETARETARYYAKNPACSYDWPRIVAPSEPAPGTVAGELRGIRDAIDRANRDAADWQRQQELLILSAPYR